MDMNKKNDKNVAIKESIEIVKKFNKENRYRDCGRINNAIDTLIYAAENSIPKQKIKDKIEEVHNMKFKDERLDCATIDFAMHKFEEILEDK